jgi:hypothetical protein
MLAAVRGYCVKYPARCMRLCGVTRASEITEAVLGDSQVPSALEDAEDALGEEPILLAGMRGVDPTHVIYEFLLPVIAARNPGEVYWSDVDWAALFARGVVDRITPNNVTSAPPELRAAEALVDAVGRLVSSDAADAICTGLGLELELLGCDASGVVRRARAYTGTDVDLLRMFDASPVLARILLVPVMGGVSAADFPELAAWEWEDVVDEFIVPVLAVSMGARVATRMLVTRMLATHVLGIGADITIRGAWLESLDDADVAGFADELTSLVRILPRRLLPALIAARHDPGVQGQTSDPAVGASIRAVLAEVADGTIPVEAATLALLVARLPSTMLSVAADVGAHELAASALRHIGEISLGLAQAALRMCAVCTAPTAPCAASCPVRRRLGTLVSGLVRASVASPDDLSELLSVVIRGQLVAEFARATDETTFGAMCAAMVTHGQFARLATLLACVERAGSTPRVRDAISAGLYAMVVS